MSDDLLEALLRAALAEGETLDERNLSRFAEALRARALQIVQERVQPIQERAAAFEKESAWRADEVRGLQKEREALLAESARRQGQHDELILEKQATTAAHDRLLAHHRATLLRLAEALESMPKALPWSYRRVRAQIAELVESLRRDGA